MAAPPKNEFEDSLFQFSKGMDSGVSPLILPKDKLAFALNATVRNGFITTRPAFQKVAINYGGNASLQSAIEDGQWQGGCFYKPDFDPETLVAQIGGRLFQFTPGAGPTATVRDVSVPADPNPSTAAQAWLWQAENYVIANDGLNVPIFFDGVSSRRSLGNVNLTVGTIAAAPPFVAPAQGASVTVILNAPPLINLTMVITINGKRYMMTPGNNPNAVSATNLFATSGVTYVAGTQVLIVPKNLGVNNVLHGSGLFIGGNALIPANAETCTIDLDSPNIPAINTGVTIAGVNWLVLDRTPNHMHGHLTRPFTGILHTIHVGDILTKTNNHDPQTLVGTLGTTFTIPAVGASAVMNLNHPYSGANPQEVWINGTDHFSLTPAPIANPLAVTLTNIDDTPATVLNAKTILAIAELPPGRMGAYGMGRVWQSLVDGISFMAGDIVGGPSGTASLSFRDAVLKVTENTFLAGGGNFRVPGSVGDIRSMTFTANLDASLGQGPLQVGTPNAVFTCQAPVDRTTWALIQNPILSQSLIGFGPLGQNNTVLVNSDTIFRSTVGLGSLILARREFYSWGNTPISNEMVRVFDRDAISLASFGSAVDFENRLLETCQPINNGNGTYHRGIVALDYEPISNMQQKLPPVYDGLWTGLNVLQLIVGQFNGNRRTFAFTFNNITQKIELYEVLRDGFGNFDNGTNRITWMFESATLFKEIQGKSIYDPIRLLSGEIYVDDIIGKVDFQAFYRPDQYPCWIPWHAWSVCSNQPTDALPNLKPTYRTRMGLPQPDGSVCEGVNNRPFREGYTFQFKLQITGHCRFIGARFKSVGIPQPEYAPAICGELCLDNNVDGCLPCGTIDCVNPDDFDIYNLQDQLNPVPPPLPFSNDAVFFVVNCGAGTILTYSGTLPGWITIDTANNRLVGNAGTFLGNSTVEATAAAQAALNDFANAGIAAGTLACSSTSCCPNNLLPSPADMRDFTITPTLTASVQRMIWQDSNGVAFIDTSNDSLITEDLNDFPDTAGCFATSVNRFYFSTGGTSIVAYDQDGNLVATIACGGTTHGCVYSPVQDRVYVQRGNNVFNHEIVVVNPNTNTVDSSNPLPGYFEQQMWYYQDQLVLRQNALFLDVLNFPGLGVLGNISVPNGFGGGFCRATSTGKLLVATVDGGSTHGVIAEYDPVTLLATGRTLDMPGITLDWVALAYNPQSGFVIAIDQSTNVVVIDPVTMTIFCTFTGGSTTDTLTPGSLGIDYKSGKIYKYVPGTQSIQIYDCP